MRTIHERKPILIGTVAIFFILVVAVIVVLSNSNAQTTSNSFSPSDVIEAEKERGDLQDVMGEDNIYPTYYVAYNITETPKSEINKGIIETQALMWYANKENLSPSDKEVSEYIEKSISAAKQTEEYKEYNDAAKKEGSTYAEIVRNDYETYRIMLTKNKLYDMITSEPTKGALTEEERNQQVEKNNNRWDAFLKKTIAEYKKTSEYRELLKKLDVCEELANEDITDVKIIEKEEQNNGLDSL